jgi:hypothetical protein
MGLVIPGQRGGQQGFGFIRLAKFRVAATGHHVDFVMIQPV